MNNDAEFLSCGISKLITRIIIAITNIKLKIIQSGLLILFHTLLDLIFPNIKELSNEQLKYLEEQNFF